MRRKALILNDTRRETGHLGCQMVMEAIFLLCEESNIEILYSLYSIEERFDKQFFANLAKQADIVIVNGEGTLHDNAGQGIFDRCLIAKEMGLRIFLVNAVWQNNDRTKEYLELFERISVRESSSAIELQRDGFLEVDTIPDLSFYKSLLEVNEQKSKEKGLAYTDNVSIEKSVRLLSKSYQENSRFYYMSKFHFARIRQQFTSEAVNHGELSGGKRVEDYLDNNCRLIEDFSFQQYSGLVTGRFHATCFAIARSQPLLAVASNTHKIEAMLGDCELNPGEYMLEPKELDDTAHMSDRLDQSQEYREKCREYTVTGVERMKVLFAAIGRE